MSTFKSKGIKMNLCTFIKSLELLAVNKAEIMLSEIVIDNYDAEADEYYDLEISGVQIKDNKVKILT